eukprot:6376090-Prymnesium_polylepis.1
MPQLTSLNLNENHLCHDTIGNFTAEGINALCAGLKKSNITSLSLEGNFIEPTQEHQIQLIFDHGKAAAQKATADKAASQPAAAEKAAADKAKMDALVASLNVAIASAT